MSEFNGQAEVEQPKVLPVKKESGKKDLIIGLLFTIAIAGLAVLVFRKKETPKKVRVIKKTKTITKTINKKGEIENEQEDETNDDDNGTNDTDDNDNNGNDE